MINNISITNMITSETVELNKDGSSVYVLDSIDWDMPNIEMQTYRVPRQVGETKVGVIVGTRKPVITGYIVSEDFNNIGMTIAEYEQAQLASIERTKKQLNKLISVYQDVKIKAGDYYLDATPTQPIKYSISETENNEVICYFMINLECFEKPLFYKDKKTVELATISGTFHFPLIIPVPETTGIILGEIKTKTSIEVENNGEAPVGCKITIKAKGGSVVNPSIYSVNTGDFIEFEGVELYDGDYIIVTTEINKEDAILHRVGQQRDYTLIGNIKNGSKFIKVEQGTNYYSYGVAEEYANSIEVSLEFEEHYFAIEGM